MALMKQSHQKCLLECIKAFFISLLRLHVSLQFADEDSGKKVSCKKQITWASYLMDFLELPSGAGQRELKFRIIINPIELARHAVASQKSVYIAKEGNLKSATKTEQK